MLKLLLSDKEREKETDTGHARLHALFSATARMASPLAPTARVRADIRGVLGKPRSSEAEERGLASKARPEAGTAMLPGKGVAPLAGRPGPDTPVQTRS